MAKKKTLHTQQHSLFEVDIIPVIKTFVESTKKRSGYTPYVDTFDHMAYGINKAVISGESIIANRNNKI